MRSFRDITEAKETAVFGFGRFNPSTIGHEAVIEKIASVAKGNPFFIYPSHTTGPKDPLKHSLKIAWMRKMFPKYKKNIIVDNKAKTVINIAEKLYKDGYKKLILVAGSDRVKEFDTLLQRYNDAPDKKGNQLFKFDSVKVVSAGERDPDADGVAGMSASKLRKAASDGKFDDFKKGIPNTLNDADKKKYYFDVRKGMGIREDREMGDDYDSLRDAYLTGKIWNVGEVVEANGVSGEVVRKGTNYLSFVAEDGKVHKAWLHEIELDERNYAKEYANYGGRPEQIARRSSRNKARRAMGDKAVKGMDVGHADNNPMNNDPKNLRMEKPSDNRREPRLREKPELDERWYNDVLAKMSQISHSSDWGKIAKEYVAGMKDPEHRKHPSAWAQDVAKQYNGVTGRQLIKYINKLVDDGKLPKELKAELQVESFSDFVKQINESCWDGYKQVGMKKKGDKEVPNCVPEEKELNEWGEVTEVDAKSGKELNNPTKGDVKKYKVYVKNAKGNVIKVEFGDPNMSIQRDDPKARANFRARHNCDQKKDKTTAGYWSCKFWSTKSVTDLMKG
jgi:hypothetical protein